MVRFSGGRGGQGIHENDDALTKLWFGLLAIHDALTVVKTQVSTNRSRHYENMKPTYMPSVSEI